MQHDFDNHQPDNQQPTLQKRQSAKLWHRLQAIAHRVKAFMIYKPGHSDQLGSVVRDQLTDDLHSGQSNYSQKARFYPYLSALEEQRDWLEASYR